MRGIALAASCASVSATTLANRNLETVDSLALCGTEASTFSSLQTECRADQLNAMGLVSWDGCCVYDASAEGVAECRTAVFETPYTKSATEEDKFVLSMDWDLSNAEDECCKSCTCFGDPECISFEDVLDIWIPCDARREGAKCHVYKDVCEDMMGPNGKACEWIGGSLSSSASSSWNIALQGSPCVPNLDEKVSMTMYKASGINVELGLGERGIISDFELTLGSEVYALNSDRCFEYVASGNVYKAWGLATKNQLPNTFQWNAVSKTQVEWTIRDPDTHTRIKLLCVRAQDKKQVGPPRINVESVTVPKDTSSSGFCETSEIAEVVGNGDTEHSKSIHEKCVQSQSDAIQACKHLVSQATPYSGLDLCSDDYCNVAALSAKEKKNCKKQMKKGTSENIWVKYYCLAARNAYGPDIVPGATKCSQMVKAQGYNWATLTWGKGYQSVESSGGCASSIDEYKISAGSVMCEAGLYIDVQNDSGDYESMYFIPANKPLCSSGPVIFNGKDSPSLFENSIQIRQCANEDTDKCSALSTCGPALGVEFDAKFTNEIAEVTNLLKNNYLQCIPKTIDGKVSVDWCFTDSLDYTVEEVCTCPSDNRRL